MKPLRILVFLTLLSLSAQVSVADNNALPDVDVSQQLAEAEKQTDNWKTAFWVMTGVYIFVYIMGRRRLVQDLGAQQGTETGARQGTGERPSEDGFYPQY